MKQEKGKGKGSNLTFPNTKFAEHVKPMKDKMAGNVGGSAAHQMSAGKKPQPGKGEKFTGGRKGGK